MWAEAGESPSSYFSTSMSFAAKWPMNAVAAQIGRPTRIIMPVSAPVMPAAATGPGWGGIATCTVRRTPATGSPILIGLMPAMRAKPKTIGARMMKATSKKTGMPRTKAAATTAPITRFAPSFFVKASARASAPPAVSMIRPSIAPRPTTIITEPRVLPMPFWSVPTTSSGAMPVTRAVPSDTRSIATKADIFSWMTSRRRTRIAPTAIPRRIPVLM